MTERTNGNISRRRFLARARLVYEPDQLRFRGNDEATALIHHSVPS